MNTILVVDDEATVANLLRELLDSSGYKVAIAISGEDALTMLDQQEESFDLIITDQNMPGMSGEDMAKRVFELYPSLPVTINSGYTDGIDNSLLAETNVKEIMQKPVQMRELLKKVQLYIQ